MNSRDTILAAIAANQPELVALPEHLFTALHPQPSAAEENIERFILTLTSIGGTAIKVRNMEEITQQLYLQTRAELRLVSLVPGLLSSPSAIGSDPHSLEDIDLAILPAHFGIAENGAVWITEEQMGQRALPFICQHLAIVMQQKNILATMHEAYERIGSSSYGFGTFIAGPSKTADIEQSLVIGAHGARSMTVYLIE